METIKQTIIIILIYAFFAFLLIHVPSSHAKDAVIHTYDDSYFFLDYSKQEIIVLPNDEIINTEDLDNLKENDEPLRTNEGIEIYRGYDNQYFMEEENHDED